MWIERFFQTKHEAEIEELRKAGHDAVAIIVEEYKVGSSVRSFKLALSCQERLVSVAGCPAILVSLLLSSSFVVDLYCVSLNLCLESMIRRYMKS